ncbi:Uncharacterised protein [Mycobacteroides abscessus subsp. bolletii]|nr:Uncharacterised protein [Mycobacteroides abscessus subsp. bolletii]
MRLIRNSLRLYLQKYWAAISAHLKRVYTVTAAEDEFEQFTVTRENHCPALVAT